MAELSIPARDSVAAQRELFRRAATEEGLSIRVLHAKDNSLKVSTMEGWRDGAAMPAWALFALGEAGVPDQLLSLVGAPFARCIVTEEPGDGDLDTAANDALEFVGEFQKARHPKSPGGVAIVPQEKALIHPKRQKACASMRRAAA
jgi:hypothetical protein